MNSDYLEIHKWDKIVFRKFFEDFYPSLCYFANKIVKDKEASNDIAQDAFIYFWQKRKSFHTLRSAKAYLFKYTKNRCLNYLRDNHLSSSNFDDIARYTDYEDFILEDEVYRMIYDAVETLPPSGKKVIELTLDGLKNKEIAKHLKISVNTVKTLKSRAFKSLREKLKKISLYLLSIQIKIY